MRARGRQKAVLRRLLEADGFLQAQVLAEALAVSTKTITRTLADVDTELARYELTLLRQAGAGYRIEGSEASRRALLADLSDGDMMPLSKEARQKELLAKVLPAAEPVKLYALAAELGVTEGTISNDLDMLAPRIGDQGLRLVRRPGLGIYVQGTEANRRRAIVRTLYEGLGSKSLWQLAAKSSEGETETRTEERFLGLVDPSLLRRIETLVRASEKGLAAPFSDDAFVGLVVHLAIALERIRKGEDIEMEHEMLLRLQSHAEYRTAKRLAADMEEVFDIAIAEGEIGYITMHLLGARSRYSLTDGWREPDNFRLVQLARMLMKRAEELSQTPLLRDASLLQGLVNHLGPSISRLEMSLDIRNPLQEEMERTYPELMELAKASAVPLEEALGQTFPPSEIAYIAMHLGAALNLRRDAGSAKRRVVVSCPTGMGTSRLLASRLKETYKEMEIAAEASVLEITDSYLDALEVDFIISMVALESVSYPFVVVSPLLTAEDRARIDSCLALLPSREKRLERKREAREEVRKETASLAALAGAAALAAALERSFFLQTVQADESECLYMAAASAALQKADPVACRRIAEAFRRREEQAPTLTLGGKVRILHAKAEDAPFAAGVLREEGSGIADLVLLAPSTASEEELSLLSAIPAALATQDMFAVSLQEGGYEEVRAHIVRIFRDFLQTRYFS